MRKRKFKSTKRLIEKFHSDIILKIQKKRIRTLKKKDLKQAIREKEIQLSKLEQHIDKSKTTAEVYNNLILEKAILNKELQDASKNKFAERIKKLVPRKKVAICDYFKSK